MNACAMEKDTVEWIFELFDEIEKPTLGERTQLVSLLLAETESWSSESQRPLEREAHW